MGEQPDRLYMSNPEAKRSWRTPERAAEEETLWLDHGGLPTRVIVSEWTVHQPQHHLPKADHLLEFMDELAADNELTLDDTYVDSKDRVLLAAAQGFIDTVAATIEWRQCAEHVADVVVEVQADRTCTIIERIEREAGRG